MRQVELAVIPSGTIRYTLNGANPKEGTLYEKPFSIGPEELTVYCHAEAHGITSSRNFAIPKAGNTGVLVNADQPARLRRKIDGADTAQTYGLLTKLRVAKAKLSSVSLEVGQGDKAVSVRFGSGTSLTGEAVEQAITALRTILGDEAADVRLTMKLIHFPWGRELSTFAGEQGLVLAPNEVEQ